MAAAAEEDTELRDLLVQTLESSGVLNKIKVGAGGAPAALLMGVGGAAAARAAGGSRPYGPAVPPAPAAELPGRSARSRGRPGGEARGRRSLPGRSRSPAREGSSRPPPRGARSLCPVALVVTAWPQELSGCSPAAAKAAGNNLPPSCVGWGPEGFSQLHRS